MALLVAAGWLQAKGTLATGTCQMAMVPKL